MVYVPGGVAFLPPPPPTVEFPPAPAQPLTPAMATASSAAHSRALRRRRSASGNSTRHSANGASRAGATRGGSTAAVATPVVTVSVMFWLLLAGTVALVGLKLHMLCAGNEPHANANVPDEPFSGVRVSLNCVACPLAADWLLGATVVQVKSNPMPESATCAAAGKSLLVTLSVPFCCPAAAGAKATLAVQLTPTASELAQVVPVMANPALALSARLPSATPPVFVTVTVCAVLVIPTPVEANVNSAGSTRTAPARPPCPVNETTAAV